MKINQYESKLELTSEDTSLRSESTIRSRADPIRHKYVHKAYLCILARNKRLDPLEQTSVFMPNRELGTDSDV